MKKKILKKGGDGCGWGREVQTILKPKWNKFKKKEKVDIHSKEKEKNPNNLISCIKRTKSSKLNIYIYI